MSDIKSLSQISTDFFSSFEKEKALKLLQDHKVNISFKKGETTRFFTISGIIKDDKTYQTRASYKAAEPNHLSSHCPCAYQVTGEHCYHVAALLMAAASQQEQNANPNNDISSSISLNLQSQGVYPREYGTIIEAPAQLEGASRAITFNQLQYILTTQKVIQFPVLKKLTDQKIKITIEDSEKPQLYNIKVSLVNEAGDVNLKVSLLGHLYLFDWQEGEAYELSSDNQFLFRHFLKNNKLIPIDDFLLRLTPLLDNPQYIIEFKEKPLQAELFEKTHLRLNISAISKNELNLNLFFVNDNNHKLSLPHFFKLFCFENGYLSEMRTKKHAYEFIEKLLATNQKNQNSLINQIPETLRANTVHWVEQFVSGSPIIHYGHLEDQVSLFEMEAFKELFGVLGTYLSSEFIRVSHFNELHRQISFTVAKTKLMEILGALNDTLTKLNIPLTFNDKKVTTWKPQIHFKRNFTNINWLDISYGISPEDLIALNSFKQNANSFINDEGELVIMDQDGLQIAKLVNFLSAESTKSKKDPDEDNVYNLKFSRSRIFELFEIYRLNLADLLTEEEKEICKKLENLDEMPKFDLCDNFENIARDYQKKGYNWLRFLYENRLGACLADEMGLGKTLQTLMFINELYADVKNILIVAPVSIISNWVSEFEHFTELPVNIYYGDGRSLACHSDQAKKISITSYGVLKKEFNQSLGEIDWDILIFDEVQKLKNANSLGAHAARNLKARFRLALTGTPVENHFGEFHNILDLTLPGIWGERFWRKHQNQEDLSIAKKIVRPFILRRTKKQVLSELPDKIETPVLLNLSEKERNFYHQNLFSIKDALAKDQSVQQFNILQFILRLRQLCLWQNHQNNEIMSTKIDFLVNNLMQIHEEGHKALIFSQFTSYLDLIQNRLIAKGWKISRIDGSLSLKKRDQELDRFQNGDSDFFLISLKAGGFGLNLTQANYIFLMDPWWNPAVENQAIDRAHRIGQTKNVIVYRPIIKDSIEEKVLILQDKKRQLFADLMGSDENNIYDGRLSRNDFIELLS